MLFFKGIILLLVVKLINLVLLLIVIFVLNEYVYKFNELISLILLILM